MIGPSQNGHSCSAQIWAAVSDAQLEVIDGDYATGNSADALYNSIASCSRQKKLGTACRHVFMHCVTSGLQAT